jgi:hypothetical protein
MKTAQDVTLDEWIALAKAAEAALGVARLQFWLDADESSDASVKECLDELAAALDSIGLRQCSMQEFQENLENVLNAPPTSRT